MSTSGKSGGTGEQAGSGNREAGAATPKDKEVRKAAASASANARADKAPEKTDRPSASPPPHVPQSGTAAGGKGTSAPAGTSSAPAGEKSPANTGKVQRSKKDATAGAKAEKPEDKSSAPSAEKKKSRAGLYTGAALVIFAAGMAAWPVLLPYVAPLLPQEARQRLTLPQARPMIEPQRLIALEDGLSAHSRSLQELRTGLEALRPLAGRITSVEKRLQALETTASGGDQEALSALREQQQALAVKLTALEQRLEALSAPSPAGAADSTAGDGGRLAALSQSLRDLRAAHAADMDRLRQRIETLSAALETIQGNGRAVAEKIDALSRRLDEVAVQARRTGSGSRAAALLIAAGQLAERARRGQPFAREIPVLKELGADPALLSRIEPLAEKGVDDRDRLLAEVPSLADQVVRAARLPQEKGWLGETLKRVSRQVSFRKTGEIAGNDVEAIAARAEAAARRGDLRAAVRELENLPGERAREAAAGWLTRARARLLLDDTVNALIDKALLVQGRGTPDAGAVKEG